jgi:molybdenum cofactor cytidylyltransferase
VSNSSRMFAVIPAAGRGVRMGRAKLLLPLGGRTVIARIIDALSTSDITERLVVVRPDDDALQRAVQEAGGTPLVPPTPPLEMRHSLEFALRWLMEHRRPADTDAWIVSPADHPVLDRSVTSRLVAQWRKCGKGILIPTCDGRRGHPVILGWRYADEVFQLPHDKGLNEVMRRHAADVVEYETGSRAVLSDLDTPEDYARLQAEFDVPPIAGDVPRGGAGSARDSAGAPPAP